MRIPTTEDFSEEYEDQTATQEEEEEEQGPADMSRAPEASLRNEQQLAPDITFNPSESSFATGNSLISSTPTTLNQRRLAEAAAPAAQQRNESMDSWAHSLESPLDRLDRDLKSLTEEDVSSLVDSHAFQASLQGATSSATRSSSTHKGKSREAPSLLQNVLTKNIRGSAQASPVKSRNTSPLKIRKTPKRNPYVPPNTKPADWDGIVDLKNTPKRPGRDGDEFSDDDADFSLPAESHFVRPLPSSSRFDVARSPAKAAAARIGRDLVGNAERLRFGGFSNRAPIAEESSMSTMSPPSLSRHTRHALGMDSQTSSDPSLDSMMRRVGLNAPNTEDSFDDSSYDMSPNPAFFGNAAQLLPEGGEDAGGDSDSSDSSFEEGNNGAPSAAFLMASQGGARDPDDSFGSSNQSSDSVSDEEAGGHPLFSGTSEDALDDSFEDDIPVGGDTEEATIFGTRAVVQQPLPGSGSGELRLHGQDLLDDTIGHRRIMHPVIPNTPTPLSSDQLNNLMKPMK